PVARPSWWNAAAGTSRSSVACRMKRSLPTPSLRRPTCIRASRPWAPAARSAQRLDVYKVKAMKVAVLGSGIIGTATAWWLSQAGHDVVVIDRESGPGQETSRANGGQISVSYSEPWANPRMPLRMLKWLLSDKAPISFRPRLDLRQWAWGLAFLRECLPSRLAPNIRAMVAMSEYSLATLKHMRADLGIDYNHLARGILNFYQDPVDFDASQDAADLMRDFGLDRRIVTADEVVQIEPALAPARATIVGGDYTAEDESGDVYLFTTALARLAQQA